MKTFKVLSIDAWAGEGEHSWAWNNWFNNGTYDEKEEGELNEENALMYFYHNYSSDGITWDYWKDTYEIYDDQYNLVLIKKENSMPLLAIEYGGER